LRIGTHLRAAALAALILSAPVPAARAQTVSQAEILERLQRLEQEQRQLRELLDAKDAELAELKAALAAQAKPLAAVAPAVAGVRPEPSPSPVIAVGGAPSPAPTPAVVLAAASPEPAPTPFLIVGAMTSDLVEPPPRVTPYGALPPPAVGPGVLGRYLGPGRGFLLVQTPEGEVSFSAYTYVRYLNQKGLDDTYTNHLGETFRIDKRNDVELNKVKLEFKGWLLDPSFRYVLYTWTNQTVQGLGAQVVVGGNVSWVFSDAFLLGGGIYPLPSVRSNEGAWPYFLGVDHRTMADEFFRGSYTIGFFANGEPLDGLRYSAMIADNLSILGVDAGQLDGRFQTVSTAVWWMPTTG